MHAAAGQLACEPTSGADCATAGPDEPPDSTVLYSLPAATACMSVDEAEAALFWGSRPSAVAGVAAEALMGSDGSGNAAMTPAELAAWLLPPLPATGMDGEGGHAATMSARSAAAHPTALPEAGMGGDGRGDATAAAAAEETAAVALPPLLPELWGAIARCGGAEHPAHAEIPVQALSSAGLVMEMFLATNWPITHVTRGPGLHRSPGLLTHHWFAFKKSPVFGPFLLCMEAMILHSAKFLTLDQAVSIVLESISKQWQNLSKVILPGRRWRRRAARCNPWRGSAASASPGATDSEVSAQALTESILKTLPLVQF